MTGKSDIVKKMDKALENKDFDRFVVFHSLYMDETRGKTKETKNMIFYKTLALLYFLGTEQLSKYHACIQSCIDPSDYEYVMKVFDYITIYDFNSLETIYNSSTDLFQELIKLNLELLKNKCNRINSNEPKIKQDTSLDTINECVYILNEIEM
ncbi:hypothetical protein A0H76_1993 [Hepatospora eriocheir]|uniref:Uncharacterized protein n=1 Tax=Hepatospora eriocheir TaxID=1081669 RepID=A0A1X0QBK1_9MICR|nr:hypothetical protein HERIO_1015 [Hepatospora eriocheir]ORE00204.1 hypothetical protein A0H76_1993 [Hepatospora eriocheir]